MPVQTAGLALCLAGAALGATGLVGWLTGTETLISFIPGQPLMMPNTAISLILTGAAGALRAQDPTRAVRRAAAAIAALVVLAIAVVTIGEYALSLKTGLDQLFIPTQEGPHPGRMSPPTAVALVFLTAAILTFDSQRQKNLRPSEWFVLCAGVIASTAILGQLFGVGPLYRLTGTPIIGVSVPTALGLFAIAWGLLLERPDAGVMSLLTSKQSGGVLLRRLAPAAVVAPAAFAVISVHVMNIHEQSQVELELAALTVISILATLAVLAVTAAYLNRAQDTITRMQAESQDLIALASEGIFVADTNGRFIDVNRAGCEMLGYTRDEILTKTVMDTIPPEDQTRLADQRERLLAGAVRVNEWNLVHKDGHLVPTEISAKILPDGRWQAFIRDISDRKRAEEEQRFLVDLGTALPATLDVDEAAATIADLSVRELADFCVVDLAEDGNKLRRARTAGREGSDAAVCEALGRLRPDYDWYSAATLRANGPILFEALTPDVAVSWGLNSEQARTVQGAGFRSALEVPLLARGKAIGRLALITTGARSFDARHLVFAESIGTLAALSLDNRRLYRSAQEATKARDEMLGVVAHDLRNPLQVIAAGAYALRAGRAGQVHEIGSEMEAATRRMNRLIQDLLDITRIEAGQLAMRPERVPVRELIEDTLQLEKGLAASAGIAAESDLPPDLPDLWADRDRVLQVLENLVGNAIKFTKPGGTVTLAAREAGPEVILSVADTGTGIAADDLPHVFERFWKAEGRGAGLGLAIVKGIVEAHGGRVWATSAPGKGSTFHFSLPRAQAGAAQQSEAVSPAGDRDAQAKAAS